jgi:hypothetical protein
VKHAAVVLLSLLAAACGSGGDSSSGDPDAGSPADPDAGAPQPGTEYIFDLDQLHEFEVEVADADWRWLQDNALLEEYVPATVIFEGVRYDDAAIRFKGAYGTLVSCFDESGERICPKLSVKVSFNEYGKGRFFGLRKLIFNSSIRDASMMHEVISYGLYRDMGVVAPRATHAKLTVNGEYLGMFTLVENIDKELIEDHFAADTGNLYKSVWPLYSDAAPYIEALRTNEDAPDVSRMIAFHAAIEGATDETFTANMSSTLDLDALARYLAVDRAISNDDGIKALYCYGAGSTACTNSNYYWYEDPQGAIQLIPWDLDYSLGDINTDLGRSYADPNPNDCAPVPFCEFWELDPCPADAADVFLLPPQCDDLYGKLHRATWDSTVAVLAELAAGPLSRDVIVPRVDAIREKIRDAVVADPNGPGQGEFDAHNAWLDEVLEQQLAAIEALVAEQR